MQLNFQQIPKDKVQVSWTHHLRTKKIHEEVIHCEWEFWEPTNWKIILHILELSEPEYKIY